MWHYVGYALYLGACALAIWGIFWKAWRRP